MLFHDWVTVLAVLGRFLPVTGVQV
jgi:hypothetical protein